MKVKPIRLKSFEGKDVRIVWRNPNDDWRHFKVLEVRRGFLKIIGLEDQGAPWAGEPFWEPAEMIRSIKTWSWDKHKSKPMVNVRVTE